MQIFSIQTIGTKKSSLLDCGYGCAHVMLFVVVGYYCVKAKIGEGWWVLYMKKDRHFTFQINLRGS